MVQNLVCLDLNICGLTLSTTQRLVDHDAGVRQAVALALMSARNAQVRMGYEAEHNKQLAAVQSAHAAPAQAPSTTKHHDPCSLSCCPRTCCPDARMKAPMDAARPMQHVLTSGRMWRMVSNTAIPVAIARIE